MLQKALEYIVGMGKKEEMTVKGKQFIVGGNVVKEVEWATQRAVNSSTLQSIIDYLKDDPDGIFAQELKVIVQIVSESEVKVFTEVNGEYNRNDLLNVEVNIPKQMNYGSFYDMESFNIMLQSRFVYTEDREKLLSLVGNVKEEAVSNVGDDGTSQVATIKTGVASVGNVKVPNPVSLAPFRTFAEVVQPESKFVFRMKSGPTAALFEADGGAWVLKVVSNIRGYLEINLKEQLGEKFEQVTILS